MTSLPTGTVTFLFTDIEGSTLLLQELGRDYGDLLGDHNRLVRAALEEAGGVEVRTEGDSFFAVFGSATAAVGAAVASQRALSAHTWPRGSSVRVRMGLHTGEGRLGGADYVGLDVHRAARISAAGHGGQVLLSAGTLALTEGALPEGVTSRDLGEHRLKDLARPEHLYQLAIPGLPAEFPALRSLDARPNNLPVQLTSFVGRGAEVAEAKALLADARLLTLTGPGGTGKTRLAVQLAADVAAEYPDGVFFVALAPIADPDLVPAHIAETLGLIDATGDRRAPLERLVEYLRGKKMLLILDNFEQLLPAATVVTELLKACDVLTAVVTSRAVLRVYGEREYAVPPLRLPDPSDLGDVESLSQYEAVALFIERARAVHPAFEVTNENAPAVAEICARLDGLPLAIELAAARIRLLPPEAILERLGKRLQFLVGGARDLPARQQTLREAIDWSYELLDPVEKTLFARVGVFAGGCALEAVERVCGPAADIGIDLLEGLTTLADKSLIKPAAAGGEIRFVMLETIREFALERLVASDEGAEIGRRRTDFFLELAERARPELTGLDRRRWLDRIEADHDNLRAALSWALEHKNAAIASRLVFALWRFWQMRSHLAEGHRACAEVLALWADKQRTLERAKALEAAGGLAHWQGDIDVERRHYEEALAIMRTVGDDAEIANAIYNLTNAVSLERELELARALAQEAEELFTRAGDELGVAKVRWIVPIIKQRDGDTAGSLQEARESLDLGRSLGDDFHVEWSLHAVGLALLGMGDHAGARAAWTEALELIVAAGELVGVPLELDNFAALALAEGDPRRSARLQGAAAALRADSGANIAEIGLGFVIGGAGARAGLVTDEERDRAWAEGRAMTLDEAVAYTLSTD